MPRFEFHNLPEPQGDWVLITLKYGGRCLGCYEWVDEGERGWWRREEGVRHEYCPLPAPAPEVMRRFCVSCFQSVPETQLDAAGLCTGCQ